MTSVAGCVRREIAARPRSWLAVVLAVVLAFQIVQLALLVVRFGKFPNYLTVHDWPANVWRIMRSTPALGDMIPIVLDEWLIEIGSMNYAFGHGIAEWSFVLMPAKLVVVLVLAILFATDVVLLRAARKTCNLSTRLGTVTAAGAGTLLAGAASMTITWVVCCAAPTWVVGLAILGLSTTAALALQPIGGWLVLAGVAALAAPAIGLASMLCERTAHSAAFANPAGSALSRARRDLIAEVTP
jgi:hypothetical protein